MTKQSKRLIERISYGILWGIYYHARLFGVFTFYVEKSKETGTWCIKRSSKSYTRFCVLFRCFGLIVFLYASLIIWISGDQVLDNLHNIELVGVLICSLGVMIAQTWLSDHYIAWTKSLLRLYFHVHRIAPRSRHFVGTQFLVILIVNFTCIVYEFFSNIPFMLESPTPLDLMAYTVGDAYLTVAIAMIFQIACVVYMLLSQLYSVMNNFICDDLCPRIQQLNPSKRQNKRLEELTYELDECIRIYDEIYKVAQKFQRLFEVPLTYGLLVTLSALTVILYHITWDCVTSGIFCWDCAIFGAKIFIDILLMTLAAHSLMKNSQMVKRMGLDCAYYARGDHQWNTTVEIFLNRLNFYEFKPNLMGFLDISNEIVLMFLSAMVTCLTFVIQYSLANSEEKFDAGGEEMLITV